MSPNPFFFPQNSHRTITTKERRLRTPSPSSKTMRDPGLLDQPIWGQRDQTSAAAPAVIEAQSRLAPPEHAPHRADLTEGILSCNPMNPLICPWLERKTFLEILPNYGRIPVITLGKSSGWRCKITRETKQPQEHPTGPSESPKDSRPVRKRAPLAIKGTPRDSSHAAAPKLHKPMPKNPCPAPLCFSFGHTALG